MKKYLWLVPVVVLILVTLACGTSSTGEKVGDVVKINEATVVSAEKVKEVKPVATIVPTNVPSSPQNDQL